MKHYLTLLAFPVVILMCLTNSAHSGTVDSATLTPAKTLVELGSGPQTIVFSALNDKAIAIKDYRMVLKYDDPLSVAVSSTSPPAAKAEINARRGLIDILWESIPPNTELTATFIVQRSSIGVSSISPQKILFHDINRKRYIGTCNTATIEVRTELVPPSPPRNVRSAQGQGSIDIYWHGSPSPDVAGYNVYKKTSSASEYSKLVNLPAGVLSYSDTAVQSGVVYRYAITAVDQAGNESEYFETEEAVYDLSLLKNYPSGGSIIAFGDINGDGIKDTVFGLPYARSGKGGNAAILGGVDVYYGGNTTGMPDVSLYGETDGSGFGWSIAVADMNKDGYDDIVVGAPYYSPYLEWPVIGYAYEAGKIYVFAGGPQISSTPVFTKNGYWGTCGSFCVYSVSEHLGESMAKAGDVNGDGYQDVVIGAPLGGRDRTGSVKLLLGGPDLTNPGQNGVPGSKAWEKLGTRVAAAGDVNKDGRDDVIATAAENTYLLSGGLWPAAVFPGAYAASSAGDMNGDGYSDFVIGSNVYFGGQTISAAPGMATYSSTNSAAPLGDINKDGYDDLLLDGPAVYLGSQIGENIADIMKKGSDVIGAEDVDNDGVRDVVVLESTGVNIYSLAPYLSLPEITLTYPQDRAYITEIRDITVNGTIKGEISRLLIKGKQVSVSADGTFNAPLTLSDGENIFEIIAETKDGRISKRTIAATYYDPTPLNLSITSPAEGDIFYTTPITVAGTLSDPNATVIVNGATAIISGNTFTATVELQEGPNTITAIATDNAGDTATVSIVARYSSTILTGTITGVVMEKDYTSPVAGVTVTIKDYLGTHTTTTDINGAFTLSDAVVGSFTATFEKPGYIPQTVSGKLSIEKSLALNINLSPLPTLNISIGSPKDGSTLNTASLTVTGSINDNAATVTVNGVRAAVNNYTFSAAVTLNEGLNTITATAVDRYGQTATQSITVTVITKGTVTGTVTDAATSLPVTGATINVKDSVNLTYTATTDTSGSYAVSDVTIGSITVTFEKPGYATQTVSGTFSGSASLAIDVRMTAVPPLSLSITSPQDGAILNSSPVTVTGNVSNNASVTVNGIQTTISGNTFTASISITEGQNTILTKAVDQYGQTVSQVVTVTLITKGAITGTVTDSSTNQPIPSATVAITDSQNTTGTAQTDINGNYTITNENQGQFVVAITKECYGTYNYTGNLSPGQTMTVNAALDPVPPTIGSIAVTNVTANSATITWTTDQPGDSLLEYGTTTGYGSSISDPALSTSHSAMLTNLLSGNAYLFRVTSKNSCGLSSSKEGAFTTASLIKITVTSPAGPISGTQTMVTGTITNPTGNETGVTVNDVIANVFDNEFVANNVSIMNNSITVSATDTAGNRATASTTVSATPATQYVKITSNIESGLSPLEATFTIDSSIEPTTTNSYITYAGPAQVEFLSMTPKEYRIKMTTEGIYYFTANVTDQNGVTYTDTIAVTVLSKTTMDALLKAKWNAMKGALGSGDVEGALTYFATHTQEKYRTIFTAVQPALSQALTGIEDFNLISASESEAEAEAIKTEGGIAYSYPVIFIKDEVGIWKLWGL